ncbi:MAG: hypothetical protein G01um10148_490 [Parcubacteria group bacterium Gr01-1014_8]|nr:MAG: hypothetical protein G01um10148_490 [Parcubacteria group bacterium Gr01-1014_8]
MVEELGRVRLSYNNELDKLRAEPEKLSDLRKFIGLAARTAYGELLLIQVRAGIPIVNAAPGLLKLLDQSADKAEEYEKLISGIASKDELEDRERGFCVLFVIRPFLNYIAEVHAHTPENNHNARAALLSMMNDFVEIAGHMAGKIKDETERDRAQKTVAELKGMIKNNVVGEAQYIERVEICRGAVGRFFNILDERCIVC